MQEMVTAAQCRAQAEIYQQAREKLLELAEILDGGKPKNGQTRAPIIRKSLETGPKTRKEELRDFLRQHPGSKRSQILENTDIPMGTISFLLKPNNGFKKKRGKWFNAAEDQGSEKTTNVATKVKK